MKHAFLALAVVLAAVPARAEEVPFGAVASAPLPRGGLAVYGVAGYPGARVGFRQGFASLELGAEAGFDYLSTTFFGQVTGRRALLDVRGLSVALDARAGGFGDAGSRWADEGNRAGAGLRLELGSSLTYRTSWPLSWLAFIKVPAEIPLTGGGNARVAGLLGGGAEIALTPDYFLLLNGAFGPDWRSGVEPTTRLSVEAMVGFGYRVF